MLGIGEKLKEARQTKNISLKQVEKETKIRKKYLKALEDENFERIHGDIYIKGFIRNYGEYLDLNAQKLVEEYNEMMREQEKFLEELENNDKGNIPLQLLKNTGLNFFVIFLIFGFLLFMVIYYFF